MSVAKDSTAQSRQSRRRSKFKTRLTSDCGTGEGKQKLIRYFWDRMWPSLEKIGWTKV